MIHPSATTQPRRVAPIEGNAVTPLSALYAWIYVVSATPAYQSALWWRGALRESRQNVRLAYLAIRALQEPRR